MERYVIKALGMGLNLWSLVAPKQAAALATQVFSTPPKPRLRPKEIEFLSTARQIHRTVAGQDIVEYHWGKQEGPYVLLSYGWAYNAGRWRHFVPALVEAGYRVLAFDPPGHGLAPRGTLSIPVNAAIIRALLETYGPAEAMIGHSFGGSSNVFALKELPRALHPRRMVVMASFSFAPGVFRQYKRTLGLWSSLYWSMVRGFERRFGYPLDYYDFALMTTAFPHIQGLLVHDSGDPVTPYTESLRYHDFWPASYLFTPAEAGHHLGTSQVTQSVLRFVVDGEIPVGALLQDQPLHAEHELVQYFVGL